MVGTTVSHYEIVEELGRGGMGVVYRAEDTRLGRTVALKVLADHLARDEAARQRFMQEARASAALTHANIATLYNVEELDGMFFITMEFIEGRSLKQLIDVGPVDPNAAINFAIQIARGLERAHESDIIHRDIKPANVIVTARGDVKILDFGLAKLGTGAGLSQTGTTLGTAAYMSPEQVKGESVDRRTDLWSLGVVLYELLAARRPFLEEYEHALYYAIINSEPAPLSQVKPSLGSRFNGLIGKLLAKSPDQRFASAGELIDALREFSSTDPAPALPSFQDLADQPPPSHSDERSSSSVSTVSEGERRPVTVLHCMLDGVEDLYDDLEPEEVHDIVQDYLRTAEVEVRRFSGRSEASTGDELNTYFGYPHANEDDPVRAVRCGLAIVASLTKLSSSRERRRKPVLECAIGIHSGLAVVKEERGEIKVLGRTGRLAAKIIDTTTKGGVVITQPTRDVCRGYFELESLGARDVRGYSEPTRIFRVVGETRSHSASRFEMAVEHDLTPLVGRDLELGLLRQRWNQASSGQGLAVLVSGEPGIGKSRLVTAFKDEVIRTADVPVTHLYATSENENSAFHPFVEHLRMTIEADRPETPEQRLRVLEELLNRAGLPLDPYLALLAGLVSIPTPDDTAPVQLAPSAQKQKTMEALLILLTVDAVERPKLIAFEDFHWADPSTQEWVDLLMGQLPSYPLLALFTTRPPNHPAWLSKAYASEITLNRLDRDQIIAISRHSAHGKQLPDEILEQVAERTDGIPLFVEELTQMLIESGILVERDDRFELTGPLPDHAIPTTLQGSLTARLDRLESAKSIAQIGSVIGRQFSYALLKAVSEHKDDALQREVAKLVDAELIFQRGFIPNATFIFKHALIQDAAYASLVKRTRQDLHRRVASALEKQTPPPNPETLAHHYTEAGLSDVALPLWKQAGELAMARNEIFEAVEHLKAGVDLLPSIEDAATRDATELQLLNVLGPAVMMSRGYGSQDAEGLFRRARELCRSISDVQLKIFSLQGLFLVYWIRADYERALEIASESLHITETVGEPTLLLLSHSAMGWLNLETGKPQIALNHADEALRLYRPAEHDALGTLGWGLFNHSTAACRYFALHLLGYPDQALTLANRLLEEVRDIDNEVSLYNDHLWAGVLHLARREWAECVEVMGNYLPSAIEFGDPFKIGLSSAVMNLGMRGAEDEDTFRSTAVILDQLAAGGFGAGLSLLLGVLAEGHLAYGNVTEARDALERAFAHTDKAGDELWQGELFRLKGDLILTDDPTSDEAEDCFRRALEKSRAQGSRMLELRAATSLARLLAERGRPDEARGILKPVFESFDEGFETADVAEAAKLLSSLS